MKVEGYRFKVVGRRFKVVGLRFKVTWPNSKDLKP